MSLTLGKRPLSPAGRRKAAVREGKWTEAVFSRSARKTFSQCIHQSGLRMEGALLSPLSDFQPFCVTIEGLLICLVTLKYDAACPQSRLGVFLYPPAAAGSGGNLELP